MPISQTYQSSPFLCQKYQETVINDVPNYNSINITRSINKLYSLYILYTEAFAGPGPSGLYPHVKNQLQQSVLCAVQLRTALPFYIAFTSQEQRPSTTIFSFLDFLMNFQISLLFSRAHLYFFYRINFYISLHSFHVASKSRSTSLDNFI